MRVLLLSLGAAGLGLNLTAASHVIMVHPWWNPFLEKQAIDRAHRIGQTRPVNVYRLFTKTTVEERILKIQVHIIYCLLMIFSLNLKSCMCFYI